MMAVSESFATALVGRAIVGLGLGAALMSGPLFAAEMAPARNRGASELLGGDPVH